MLAPISFTKIRSLIFLLALSFVSKAIAAPLLPAHEFCAPPPLSIFVGRDDELNQLRNELKCKKIAYVVGLPGIGKTSFVQHYSLKSRDQYHFILWLNLASALEDQLVNFGKTWNLKNENKIPDHFLFRPASPNILNKWLIQQDKRWLVVMDNYNPSYESLIQKLKGNKNISLVIISREKCSDQPITINSLNLKESVVLLDSFVGENKSNETLAALLGNYPLALRQAGILIKNFPSLSVNQYIEYYKRSKKDLEKLHVKSNKLLGENEMTMEITVLKHLEKLDADHDEVIIRNALTYLHGSHFSYTLLKEFADQAGIAEIKLHQIIFDLCRNLIIQQKSDNEYEIHDSIQKAIRENIPQNENEKILGRWVDVFKKLLIQDYVLLDKVTTEHPLLYQHAKKILSFCETSSLAEATIKEFQIILCHLARYYFYEDNYSETLSDVIYKYLENHNNIDVFLQARYYNTLGNLLVHKDINQSINYVKKAIMLLEGQHTTIAKGEQFFALVNNLGDFYLETGDLLRSLKSFDKAEKILDKIPPGNLYKFLFYSLRGYALMNKGDNSNALKDVEVAETLIQKPLLAIIVARVKAHILSRLGSYDKALNIANNMVTEIMRVIDDPINHKVISLKALIAYCTFKLGDFAEAEKLADLVLSDLNTFEKTHPINASLFGYAYRISGEIFMARNKWDDALVYFQKSLGVYQSAYKKFELDDISQLYLAFVQYGLTTNDAPLATLHFRNQLRNFGLEHPRTTQMISLFDQKGISVPWPAAKL